MLGAAVLNNALWCDVVVRANRGLTQFDRRLWRALQAAPRFYPDAITLCARDSAARVEALRALGEGRGGMMWSAKDSFADLDLSSLGMHVLFEAQWICRPSRVGVAQPRDDRLMWRAVEDETALAQWRRGFAQADAAPDVFDAALIGQPGIRFVGAWHGRDCLAGAVFNRHAGVCGVSNVFTPDEACRARIVELACRFAEDAPLAGYETDPAPWRALGFETLGPLRIWRGGR
ncbi:MAG TPA: hypothetical protein VMH86_13345 [Rhizomicrobium sp.]|nr:hypothetical protein [Rhizomicrobium sp.]